MVEFEYEFCLCLVCSILIHFIVSVVAFSFTSIMPLTIITIITINQIKRSYDVLKPLFDEHIASDDGQAIFAGQDRWEKVLATLPVESIVNRLSQKWSRTSDDSTSSEKWAQVEAALLEYTAKPKEAKRAMLNKGFELEKWRLELVSLHIDEV